MKLEVIASPELHRFGLPKFGTPGAAAIDLRALLNDPESTLAVRGCADVRDGRVQSVVLEPGETMIVNSGLRIFIRDPGYAGLILPRSGTGSKGLVLGNGTGLIDSDYQGPLKLVLFNRSKAPIQINDGDRVAQYVLVPVVQFDLQFVDLFTEQSERGEGGFGSTGVK